MSIVDFIDWLGSFRGREWFFVFSSLFWRFMAALVYIVCTLVQPFLALFNTTFVY